MKKYFFILICLLAISCTKEKKEEYSFIAISSDKKDTAYLEYTKIDNQFVGKYQTFYADKSYDHGYISGEIIGDTLKGRYKYTSRRNSKNTKPIALLKDGKNLKLGTGMVSVYSQIPFYANGSITFPDSLLLFEPINNKKTF